MKAKSPSPKEYAEILFLETKKIFKEFHLTRADNPLVVTNVNNLAFLSFITSLFEILTKEKKISFLKKVIEEYRKILKREFSGEIAIVKTAAPLTEEEKIALNERLASLFGRYYHLFFEIEPELIGGLVVEIGDKVLDESVLGKMKELARHLNL